VITNEQQITFDKVVDIISKCNMNSHLVVIGSWAEYLYNKNNILGSTYNSIIRTRDIDFLIRNKNIPARKIDFIEKMNNAGFILDMSRTNNINRFLDPKSGMEVEFLLQERGQGQTEGHRITSLGITVEGLRHLDILQANLYTVEHNGNKILVPSPESYVLHKLIINKSRQEEKKNKDIEAAIHILDCITEVPAKCASFEFLKGKLSKNETKTLENVVKSSKRLLDLFMQISEKCKESEQPKEHNLDSEKHGSEDQKEKELAFIYRKGRLQINEKIISQEIEDILGLHEKWLYEEPGGKRADFSGKDLSGIDLSGIDLSGAAFYGANLTGASLKGSILENAGLDATLDGADLSGADLRGAVLPENIPDNVKLDNVIWQDEPEFEVFNEEIDLPLGDNEPGI